MSCDLDLWLFHLKIGNQITAPIFDFSVFVLELQAQTGQMDRQGA